MNSNEKMKAKETETIHFILLVFLFEVSAAKLTPTHLNLIRHVVTKSPECTALLYGLSNADISDAARQSENPFVITEKFTVGSEVGFRNAMSVLTSGCVTIFGNVEIKNTIEIDRLGEVMRHNTHRTIILFHSDDLHSFLEEDIVNVHSVASGNLLLRKFCSTKAAYIMNMWITDKSDFLIPNLDLTSSQSSCRSSLKGSNSVTLSLQPSLYPYVFALLDNSISGAEFDVFKIVAEKVGFKFRVKREKFRIQKDKRSKKWLGIPGSIINGTSQFGITMNAIFRPEDTLTFPVDFAAETYQVDHVLLIPRPRPLRPLANFLRPFSTTLWIVILVTSVVVCSFICLVARMIHDRSISASSIIFEVYGTLWAQKLLTTETCPKSNFVIVVLGIWIVCTFFKGAAYACNFRAFMVKKTFEPPIETDSDLIEHNTDLYFPYGSPIASIYQTSNNPLKKMIYERAEERKTIFVMEPIMPIDDECRMVKERGAAVEFSALVTERLMDIERHCGPDHGFTSSKTPIEGHATAIIMPMYQPWKEEVNDVINRIVDSGIMEHRVRMYIPVNQYTFAKDVKKEEDELKPFEFQHIEGALIALGVGLSMSTVVFMLEVAVAAFGRSDRFLGAILK